jgi:tetratricopeptide (TPR) repeat protein
MLCVLPMVATVAAAAQSTDAEFYALGRANRSAEIETLARARLAEDPADDVALWHLGRIVSGDAAKRDALIPSVEHCVEQRPRSARCHNLLGSLYGSVASSGSMSAGLKLADRIKEQYLRAVELEPRNFAYVRDLNQYYLRAPGVFGGSVSKAVQAAADYGRLDPQRGRVLRAEVHVAEEEFDAATAMLATIRAGADLELADAVRSATAGLGFALIEDGQPARAHKVFERLVATDPNYASAWFGLGRALLEQKQYDPSIAALQRSLALDPRTRAHYRLGMAYQAKGDAERSLAALREFLRYSPQGRAADDARRRVAAMTK